MRSPGWRPLAATLATSGLAHLATPAPFERIVPAVLGAPRPWVTVSGLAELACAGALAAPRTRSRAGWACAALLVAVYPANVTMALRTAPRTHARYRRHAPHRPAREVRARRALFLVALARLPLQVPLVWWAVSVARTPVPVSTAPSAPSPPPTHHGGASPTRHGAVA